MGKPCPAGLFLFFLLFLGTTRTCWGTGNLTLSCFQVERQALLKFRDSLKDPFHLLSSWVGNDCCSWNGVGCDEATGHVIKLDLHQGFRISGNISYVKLLVGHSIHSSLLDLKYLEYLDLSGNDFQGSSIPEYLGSMKQLRYLNLSSMFLSGTVPSHLGNLSNLQAFDISWGSTLTANNLDWVSRLSSLQSLDMSDVDLSQVRHLMKMLSMSPSLLDVRMAHCRLDNSHLFHAYFNSTIMSNVQHLDLHGNSFEGKFPDFVQHNLTFLRVLDFSSNMFSSSVPLFFRKSIVELNLAQNEFSHIECGNSSATRWVSGTLKKLDLSSNLISSSLTEVSEVYYDVALEEINLSFNQLKGPIPTSLGRLTSLRSLDLSGNQLKDPIPTSLGRLTSLRSLDLSWNQLKDPIPTSLGRLTSLRSLDLSGNQLKGPIPTSLGRLTSLRSLDLSENQLKGPIPTSLGRLTSLRSLDLSKNQLNGTIPKSLGQLSKLESVDMSLNSLEGTVSEAHFASCSMLKSLNLGYNFMLTLDIQPGWIPPFQLNNIQMGSCKVGPQFPLWLQTQRNVDALDLSNASISGTLPYWLLHMNLSEIDLSHNHITGSISTLFESSKVVHYLGNLVSEIIPPTKLSSLLLNDNLLSGSIPEAVCKISSELNVLDLSKNRLQGDVPDCWKDLKDLHVLKLSSNMLTGVIPSSFGQLTWLGWLRLNNNSFHGELPLDLRNCTSLVILDVGENRISGNIPKWIGGNLTTLKVLRLHENKFSGSLPLELCQLSYLKILDLARNSLTGKIPPCLGNLSGMTIQEDEDLFEAEWEEEDMVQVMKGVELEYTSTLVYVFNMDLSCNKLTGEIPQELTALNALIGLNFSRNNLTGVIPDRIGSLKSLISLDFSWNNLSGVIPASMADLTFLSQLNLSFNHFSGRIPSGNQLQTLTDPSIYAGNNQLCGTPLPNKCPGDESSQVPTTGIDKEEDEDEDSEKLWLYSSILSGFVTGFSVVIGVLALKESWRKALWRLADGVLVAIAIRVAKLKRRGAL